MPKRPNGPLDLQFHNEPERSDPAWHQFFIDGDPSKLSALITIKPNLDASVTPKEIAAEYEQIVSRVLDLRRRYWDYLFAGRAVNLAQKGHARKEIARLLNNEFKAAPEIDKPVSTSRVSRSIEEWRYDGLGEYPSNDSHSISNFGGRPPRNKSD